MYQCNFEATRDRWREPLITRHPFEPPKWALRDLAEDVVILQVHSREPDVLDRQFVNVRFPPFADVHPIGAADVL
jgi:hypothetical protein